MLLAELTRAALRRKRWEARLLAVEVVNALGEAFAAGEGVGASPGTGRVSADALLGQMGLTI